MTDRHMSRWEIRKRDREKGWKWHQRKLKKILHWQHLREVNGLLTEKRSQLAPKAKFAFKRKAKPATQSTTSTTTSLPAAIDMTSEVSQPPSSSYFLSIRDKQGQMISIDSVPLSESKQATDLHILNLQDCQVDLRNLNSRPPFLALQLRNLHRCVILCGSIEGSTMIHDCKDSLIVLACRQVSRCKDWNRLDLFFFWLILKLIFVLLSSECTRLAQWP